MGFDEFAAVFWCVNVSFSDEESPPRSSYKEPRPAEPLFDESELTLHAFERERAANVLAAYVVTILLKSDHPEKFEWASRFLGLALQIHGKNPGG